MSNTTRYQVNSPAVIEDTIDGEVIIANLGKGLYYSLDGLGGAIWNALAKGSTVYETISYLEKRCTADDTELQDAVHDLLQQLLEEELIVPDPSAFSITTMSASLEVEPLSFTKPVLQKYRDMEMILMLDPIHEVDDTGWPSVSTDAQDRPTDVENSKEDTQ